MIQFNHKPGTALTDSLVYNTFRSVLLDDSLFTFISEGYSVDDLLGFIVNAETNGIGRFFLIFNSHTGSFVGLFGWSKAYFIPPEWNSVKAYLASNYRGGKLATDAINYLRDCGFEKLTSNLVAGTLATNKASIALISQFIKTEPVPSGTDYLLYNYSVPVSRDEFARIVREYQSNLPQHQQ